MLARGRPLSGRSGLRNSEASDWPSPLPLPPRERELPELGSAEQLGHLQRQRARDLVERGDRRRRFRALDLREQRDRQTGPAGELLQGQLLALARLADHPADRAVKVRLGILGEALLRERI